MEVVVSRKDGEVFLKLRALYNEMPGSVMYPWINVYRDGFTLELKLSERQLEKLIDKLLQALPEPVPQAVPSV